MTVMVVVEWILVKKRSFYSEKWNNKFLFQEWTTELHILTLYTHDSYDIRYNSMKQNKKRKKKTDDRVFLMITI